MIHSNASFQHVVRLNAYPFTSHNGFYNSHHNVLIPQLVKLAKRLKKEKVNVDIINFGEEVNIGAENANVNVSIGVFN